MREWWFNLPPWFKGAAKIFALSLGTGIADAIKHGEIHSWMSALSACEDAILPAAGMSWAWLKMTSPSLADDLKELKSLRENGGDK